jgi:uncharacterized protein (TIGR02001 family)
VIARAARRGRNAPHWHADQGRRLFLQIVIAAILLPRAAPASAGAGTAVSIFSDDRFRGFSLSDHHPVAILDLSYDSADGIYAAASGTLVASSREGVRPLGLQLNGGYARQLKSGLTLDVGLIHARYARYSGLGSGRSYTDVYAGLEGKLLSSRIHYSPRYLGDGATAYAELDGHLPALGKVTIEGHAGLLVPLYSQSRGYRSGDRYDWQVGVSRPAGAFVFHAALSGGGPRQRYYGDYSGGHALTLGVGCAL